MNEQTYAALALRIAYRAMLGTRYMGANAVCNSFDTSPVELHDAVQRICVINLDREPRRWAMVQRELRKIKSRSGTPLTAITRRLAAVDARHLDDTPDLEEVEPSYSLADQLFVDPNPLVAQDEKTEGVKIEMTRQEVAVALSHIAAWRFVATGDRPYTLVLEDDVYACRGFSRAFGRAWAELMNFSASNAVDLLYVSYKEARARDRTEHGSEVQFRPSPGLWQLSGYVLSIEGARKLLELLPVRGPVDLWINHQFEVLDVFATPKPLIKQRLDYPSGNSYSVLPVLSTLGVLTREKPLLHRAPRLPRPVFAFGEPGSGLTSLAMALSILGYRCCSDVKELPRTEHDRLFRRKRGRVFDAYVNVGTIGPRNCLDLARLYPGARFILTSDPARGDSDGGIGTQLEALQRITKHVLVQRVHACPWDVLCDFIGCDQPRDRYPACADQLQRALAAETQASEQAVRPDVGLLSSDSAPWIAAGKRWRGVELAETGGEHPNDSNEIHISEHFRQLSSNLWMLREDTFPSNLAIFTPHNFSIDRHHVARLTLSPEKTLVRSYTSAAICSRQRYLYGQFEAEVKPANVSGMITGVFLHRNSPRQEIDIEFLGKDTTTMLVNVYYNPGCEGGSLEYGYRGTPAVIDLGFDASQDFHRYEIDWCPTSIRWRIDGQLVHERVSWNPTPIPHLPMEFNVNLWHSKSREFSGRLAEESLPAHTEIRSICLASARQDGESSEGAQSRQSTADSRFDLRHSCKFS